jgi:hypothetical protein
MACLGYLQADCKGGIPMSARIRYPVHFVTSMSTSFSEGLHNSVHGYGAMNPFPVKRAYPRFLGFPIGKIIAHPFRMSNGSHAGTVHSWGEIRCDAEVFFAPQVVCGHTPPTLSG